MSARDANDVACDRGVDGLRLAWDASQQDAAALLAHGDLHAAQERLKALRLTGA